MSKKKNVDFATLASAVSQTVLKLSDHARMRVDAETKVISIRLLGDEEVTSVEAVAPEAKDPPGIKGSVIRLLRRRGTFLTSAPIRDGLNDEGVQRSSRTWDTVLAEMVRDGYLVNGRDGDPPGYGLPEWDGQ